jgi:heme/copper-type cytochrome/quinol oxidase subunit 3
MARSSAARRLDEPQSAVEKKRPGFGGGDPPGPPIRLTVPVVSNARLGVLMFLATEAMFFAGLIGAFLVFRLGSLTWPPPFQPRLPVGVTGVNTMVLVMSALTMHLGLRALRSGDLGRLIRYLAVTAALGASFLAIQGYEWVRLIHFGLTVSSSVYGGLFYTLIGFHGLHVFGALIWLLVVFVGAKQGRFSKHRQTGLVICSMYWTFVVALWPILYVLVYLY